MISLEAGQGSCSMEAVSFAVSYLKKVKVTLRVTVYSSKLIYWQGKLRTCVGEPHFFAAPKREICTVIKFKFNLMTFM